MGLRAQSSLSPPSVAAHPPVGRRSALPRRGGSGRPPQAGWSRACDFSVTAAVSAPYAVPLGQRDALNVSHARILWRFCARPFLSNGGQVAYCGCGVKGFIICNSAVYHFPSIIIFINIFVLDYSILHIRSHNVFSRIFLPAIFADELLLLKLPKMKLL
jgi:hypothetical protein